MWDNVIEISLFVMLQQMIGFCKAFQFIENMLDDEAPPFKLYACAWRCVGFPCLFQSNYSNITIE